VGGVSSSLGAFRDALRLARNDLSFGDISGKGAKAYLMRKENQIKTTANSWRRSRCGIYGACCTIRLTISQTLVQQEIDSLFQ